MRKIGRPVQYFGSKERVVDRIHRLIPPKAQVWVDLFCGSGIVTLTKPRHQHENINDLNGEIVSLFKVLRDDGLCRTLLEAIYLTPYSEVEFQEAAETVDNLSPVESVRRFLVRSWMGHGGDQDGTGFRHVVYGGGAPQVTWANLASRLDAIAARLRGVAIWQRDALELLEKFDRPVACVFVDPPYPDQGWRYRVRMDDSQHQHLAERLAACKASVILTMASGTVYGQVLADWHQEILPVRTDMADVRDEVVFCNFKPETGLLDLAAGEAA